MIFFCSVFRKKLKASTLADEPEWFSEKAKPAKSKVLTLLALLVQKYKY